MVMQAVSFYLDVCDRMILDCLVLPRINKWASLYFFALVFMVGLRYVYSI
jgi:hypothetical protein